MQLPSIRSRLGYFLYLTLRNDTVWERLRPADKTLVHEANRLHNNLRPDYADPELYQGGRNYDSTESRTDSLEGRKLQEFLEKVHPESVIEIGPGSGFYTRSLVTYPTVRSFVAIDIVQAFLDFLESRLKTLKEQKPGFAFKLINGDFLQMDFDPVSAIVLMSTIHHIPNRVELLEWIHKNLKTGGRCFVYEPTHYWPRLKSIVGKYFRIYIKASHRAEIANFSTHHFCTLEEFEAISKQVPGLKIESFSFHRMDFPRFTRKVLNRIFHLFRIPRESDGSIYVANRKSVLRFFSQRMFIEFKKVS